MIPMRLAVLASGALAGPSFSPPPRPPGARSPTRLFALHGAAPAIGRVALTPTETEFLRQVCRVLF